MDDEGRREWRGSGGSHPVKELSGKQKRILREAAARLKEVERAHEAMARDVGNLIGAAGGDEKQAVDGIARIYSEVVLKAIDVGMCAGVGMANGHDEAAIREWFEAGGLEWMSRVAFKQAEDFPPRGLKRN